MGLRPMWAARAQVWEEREAETLFRGLDALQALPSPGQEHIGDPASLITDLLNGTGWGVKGTGFLGTMGPRFQ